MKLFLCIIVSISILFPLSKPAFAQATEQKMSITVMTYNIHRGIGIDKKLNLTRIAKVIKESGAEIIGLQEVDRFYGERSGFKDQVRELADILGYHYVYGANGNLPPAKGRVENRQYGMAIFSKYPIIESKHTKLTALEKPNRGILYAKINVNGKALSIFNTHLSLSTRSRLMEVQEINELTKQVEGPKVLLGDFNTSALRKEFRILLTGGKWIDTFAKVKDAQTFPADDPDRRIDYILISSSITASQQRVIRSQASDHLAIMSRIVIH
ncbi:endonuclease/exonuclease/phosphatase family protein [Caldibacillus lycopersici]|uniref:Endonuclease/exonuclease/phosphatase family protein n=1 Tax=Perspicuibacillus lycopersici TaxID=1325689 RepID=A0AAE3ISU5_9BACI|nr:endonuclease/exonuclease/phosphatase family protein [Perspicuibacillus lycopersici]MCU9613008.1 endonuclease/exonuclease/phosphatase family protein [Perspicuibacillus lycopersici]